MASTVLIIQMQKQSSLSSNSETFRVRYEKQPLYAQLEAVTATKGHQLVVAGAARDKPRTLTNCLIRPAEDGSIAAPILLLAITC